MITGQDAVVCRIEMLAIIQVLEVIGVSSLPFHTVAQSYPAKNNKSTKLKSSVLQNS
jgi:hypothetical protein